MRKSVVVAGILAASLLPAGPVLAAPIRPIGPRQFFDGLVNTSARNGAIRLACPSPFHAGETGHPVSGQSVSVHQLFPPVATGLGFTGGASTIAATLHVVSASTASATAPIPLAVFSLYDWPVAIPTTLSLPCGGGGAVVFDPVQGGNASRAYTVRVRFPFIAAVSG
jgi:hypothetical protein